MRNLKKILSLALALVMVMSLLTVVSAREFSDADAIEHTEAVEVMSALGVINGRGNNTFDPKGNVTRGEMAKMITYISLGNVEPTAFLGTTTNLTDINGHWAEAYIKYCYSQGIISGRGNGIFDPNASVTATEAARMLLVAIGYNAEVQVYTGSQWAINVVRDAQISKLYDELTVTSDEVLSRDKAAQMMYNALTTKSVTKTASQSITTGEIIWEYNPNGDPLLTKSFDAKVFVGTFEGNYNSIPTNVLKGEIQVAGRLDTDPETVISNSVEVKNTRTAHFPSDFDIANIGEEVKVIYKEAKGGTANTPDKNDTIYGVYKTGATTVYNITKSDLQGPDATDLAKGRIKFGGSLYEIAVGTDDSDVFVEVNCGAKADVTLANIHDDVTDASTDGSTAATKVEVAKWISNEYAKVASVKGSTHTNRTTFGLRGNSADSIKFVCDNDGKIVKAYVTERDFAVVANVTSTKVSLKPSKTLTIADHNIYSDIAKDDVVVVTNLYDTDPTDERSLYIVEKAEILNGVISQFYNGGKKVAVDGTVIEASTNATALDLADTDDYTTAGTAMVNSEVLGEEYSFVMYGKHYVAYKPVGDAMTNTAIILAANYGDNITGQSVKLLQADGLEVTYKISPKSEVGNTALGSYYDTLTTGSRTNLTDTLGLNNLVAYQVMNDGSVKMSLKDIATGTSNGSYAKGTKSISVGNGTYLTATGAVAFVYDAGASKWKVVNASSLDNLPGTGAGIGNVQYKKNASNLVTVFAIGANRVSSAAGDYQYLYINTHPYAYVEGGKYYTQVTGVGANGEDVTIVFEDNEEDNALIARDNFIRYKVGANNMVDISNVMALTKFGKVVSPGYDAARNVITLSSGTCEVDSDVVIINVDTDARKAGTGVGVDEYDSIANKENIAYLMNDDGTKIVAIFVDDGRDIRKSSYATSMQGKLTEDLTTTGEATIDSTDAAEKVEVVVGANQTLTINANLSANGNNIELNGGKVKINTAVTDLSKLGLSGEGTVEITTGVGSGTAADALADTLGGTVATKPTFPADGETATLSLTRPAITLTGTGSLSSFSSTSMDDYTLGTDAGVKVYEIPVTVPDGYKLTGERQGADNNWNPISGTLASTGITASGDDVNETLVLLESTGVKAIKLTLTNTTSSATRTIIYNLVG